MKFSTVGSVPRVDIAVVADLAPELVREWQLLRFDELGWALNPETGESDHRLQLIGGRHRAPGAQYQVTKRKPKLELQPHLRIRFERELKRLHRDRAPPSAHDELKARRLAASTAIGHEDVVVCRATLNRDSARELAFTFFDDKEIWQIDIDIAHARFPCITLEGQADLTAALRTMRTPGCIARMLGGTGKARVVVDTARLEGRGTLVKARGRANRFRGQAGVEVESTPSRWSVSAEGKLSARGLARPILWKFRRRVEERFDEAAMEFWNAVPQRAQTAQEELDKARREIAAVGGPREYVRQELWKSPTDNRD